MLREDKIITFCIESREDEPGVWLCVDDGAKVIPLAEFVSEIEVQHFLSAQKWYFQKAQAMALLGI